MPPDRSGTSPISQLARWYGVQKTNALRFASGSFITRQSRARFLRVVSRWPLTNTGQSVPKLFWNFTPVRVVLHGLRRSRLVDRRLGAHTTGSRGICHLLGEYTVARPRRLHRL